MIAETLMSNSIVPLRWTDTGDDALRMMEDFHVRHLPIVDQDQKLVGMISEEDALNSEGDLEMSGYSFSLPPLYVHSYDHIYEVMRLLAEYHLTIVPVVDKEQHYLGLITMERSLHHFAEMSAFKEPGCILVLEVGKRDYSMAEIARIVESENAVILSSFVTVVPDSMRIEVTLKINRQQIQSLVSTFERFNYQIKASFNESDYLDTLQERYDALMSYLNV